MTDRWQEAVARRRAPDTLAATGQSLRQAAAGAPEKIPCCDENMPGNLPDLAIDRD